MMEEGGRLIASLTAQNGAGSHAIDIVFSDTSQLYHTCAL